MEEKLSAGLILHPLTPLLTHITLTLSPHALPHPLTPLLPHITLTLSPHSLTPSPHPPTSLLVWWRTVDWWW